MTGKTLMMAGLAVTWLIALVSCASQRPPLQPPQTEPHSPKPAAEEVKLIPVPRLSPDYLAGKTPDPPQETPPDKEEVKQEFWPNGKLKSEWKTNRNFVRFIEYYESGVKSGEWLAYNSGSGGPGHVKSIERWDEDGVECYSHVDHFTYVDDLSALGDEAIDEQIKYPFGQQHLVGIYARRNQSLTDAGLEKFSALTALQWIDITGCSKISERAIAEFKKALPNCEVRR